MHAAHDLPGVAAVSADRWNPEQRGRGRAPRTRVRRRRRRHGQDGRARRAGAGAGAGRHADRPPARDHVHRPGGVGAAPARARGPRARGRDGAGAGDRHGLDLDHPPLLPARPARERVRRRARPALRGRRRGRLPAAALRGVRHRARAVPGGAPPDDGGRRLDLLAAYGRRRLRETLSDVHEQLRSAGRPLELRPHAVADLPPARRAAARAAARLDHERARGSRPCSPTAPGPAALTDLRRTRSATPPAARTTTPPARGSRRRRSTRRRSPTGPAGGAPGPARHRLRRAQGRPQPGRLHRPRAAHARPPDRAARPGRRPTASASPACSWTSSRTRTGCSAS